MNSAMPSAAVDPLPLLGHDAALWRGKQLAAATGAVLPTGFAALDAELPGGGWPAGALIELLADRPGAGEISLLLPLLQRASTRRWLSWIAPPLLPYAPALAAAGVALDRLLLIRPASNAEILWATRQAAASGGCALVLSWPGKLNNAALRRLQLSAEASATPLFLFRPLAAVHNASPAPLRIRLFAAVDGVHVDIVKRRGPPAAAPLFLPLRADAGIAPVASADHGIAERDTAGPFVRPVLASVG